MGSREYKGYTKDANPIHAIRGLFSINCFILDATQGASEMLQQKQKQRIEEALNLANESFWKILVLDGRGQEILTPLFKVNDLRILGVTVHTMLHTAREKVEDVPAVYMVLPTRENISRITKDMKEQLYGRFYVFFISPVAQETLSYFAEECVRKDIPLELIRKITDVCIDFVCVDHSFFSLEQKDIFNLLESAETTEKQIEQTADTVSACIWSVLSVMQATDAAIRCPERTAAELVSRRLDEQQQKNTENRGRQRTSLVHVCILDRSCDMATPLLHPTEYNALVYDMLDVKRNRATYTATNRKQVFDIEKEDSVWNTIAKNNFAEVAVELQKLLKTYKTEEAKVTGGRELTGPEDAATMTKAVEELPQLLEKKRIISGHLGLAEAIMKLSEERSIDRFFSVEQSIEANAEQVMQMLSDKQCGSEEDRKRLAVLSLLSLWSLERQMQIENALGSSLPVFQRIRNMQSFHSSAAPGQQARDSSTTLFSTLVSSVKTFVPDKTGLPLTKKVLSLEQNTCPSGAVSFGMHRPRPDILIVFVVGGITYTERNDIERVFSKTCRQIIVGSTEVQTGEGFLAQLDRRS